MVPARYGLPFSRWAATAVGRRAGAVEADQAGQAGQAGWAGLAGRTGMRQDAAMLVAPVALSVAEWAPGAPTRMR